MTREIIIDFVFLAIRKIPAATLQSGFKKNVLDLITTSVVRVAPEVHVEEQGDEELALALEHNVQVEREQEHDEAEDVEVDVCCFCEHDEGDTLASCKTQGCARKFHRHCAAEYNGKDRDEYCESHCP